MALQVLTQATAPSKILGLRDRARFTEPQGCLGRQIGMQVVKVLGGQGIQITGLRALGELNQGFSEIIPNRLAVLGDNRTVIQHFTKHITGKGQQIANAIVAQCCRSTHADQLARWCIQPPLEAANQTSQISTLRTIKGMQLVHHQITQCVRQLMHPQRGICRTQQQKVQHLVVSQ